MSHPQRKKKLRPQVKIARFDKKYYVYFWIEKQGFKLALAWPKNEAEWMADQLKKAFKKIL